MACSILLFGKVLNQKDYLSFAHSSRILKKLIRAFSKSVKCFFVYVNFVQGDFEFPPRFLADFSLRRRGPQRKIHSSRRVFVDGALHVNLIQIDHVLARPVGHVVQLVIGHPVVGNRKARAVIQI